MSTDLAIYAVGGLVVVCGLFGYLRGWRRETLNLASLLLCWGIVAFAGRPLVWLVDRAWLIASFAFGGGFDTPDANVLLRELRAHPLIDPASPYPLYAATFVLVVAAAYSIGSRSVDGPGDAVAGIAGAGVGMLNGYIASCVLLVYVAPAFFGRGLADAAEQVGRYSTPALALGAGVVALALIVVLRGRDSAHSRSARSRAR